MQCCPFALLVSEGNRLIFYHWVALLPNHQKQDARRHLVLAGNASMVISFYVTVSNTFVSLRRDEGPAIQMTVGCDTRIYTCSSLQCYMLTRSTPYGSATAARRRQWLHTTTIIDRTCGRVHGQARGRTRHAKEYASAIEGGRGCATVSRRDEGGASSEGAN